MPATRRAVMTALTTPTVTAVTVHESHRVLSVSVIDPVVVKEMTTVSELLSLTSGMVE